MATKRCRECREAVSKPHDKKCSQFGKEGAGQRRRAAKAAAQAKAA